LTAWRPSGVVQMLPLLRLGRWGPPEESQKQIDAHPQRAPSVQLKRGYAVPGYDLDRVPIEGRVYSSTAFGVFFDGQIRRFFLPHSMLPLNRKFSRGENVTLNITRGYARREGLVA